MIIPKKYTGAVAVVRYPPFWSYLEFRSAFFFIILARTYRTYLALDILLII